MTISNPYFVRAFMARSHAQRRARARRRVALGMALALLLHVLLLWLIWSDLPLPKPGASPVVPTPLMVTLTPDAPQPSARAPIPTPPTPPPPTRATRAITPPKARNQPKPTPRPTAPPLVDVGSRMAQNAPALDMSSMLEAARTRRRDTEARAASENATASERAPSGNDIAQANVNFQARRNQGYSGVFQILHTGPRIAQFLFVGWTSDARDSRRQTITVDAGPNGDIQTAIIDRMIELIRVHYSGDFNWDSRRLGRVVVLSARPGDQKELRSFMMHEFFDPER